MATPGGGYGVFQGGDPNSMGFPGTPQPPQPSPNPMMMQSQGQMGMQFGGGGQYGYGGQGAGAGEPGGFFPGGGGRYSSGAPGPQPQMTGPQYSWPQQQPQQQVTSSPAQYQPPSQYYPTQSQAQAQQFSMAPRFPQPPNGTMQGASTSAERKTKIVNSLQTIRHLFKRLRVLYDKANENCAQLEDLPSEKLIPFKDDPESGSRFDDRKMSDAVRQATEEHRFLMEVRGHAISRDQVWKGNGKCGKMDPTGRNRDRRGIYCGAEMCSSPFNEGERG
ncbi:unnamed protein product [Darwinula stevensoni]|uniref:Mediator of RNA polymerase II transcription subunit 30 n=1 Tax=Darwinula stevensoni TaxID=69355 RepID=A0A7R8X768_9CRUS|nr:unnamed protein product [Darwinula stevensoni]CAG0882001.1 unnamed protein product [Darwinula stevensoni]